jgi:amino acid adenylation domain-containing protein
MSLDSFPLTPVQYAMAGAWLRRPQSGLNVEQWIVTFREEVDSEALHSAWFDVVERFGMLRAAVDLTDPADPRQVIHSTSDDWQHRAWHQADWRERHPDTIEAEWRALLEADRRDGLDLTRPPLWNVRLITLADGETRFLCTYHHVLLCGRSLVEVGRALSEAYESRRRGCAATHEREAPFAAFVARVQAGDSAASATYWRRYLAGCSPVRLPQPHGPPTASFEPGAHASVEIERVLDVVATSHLRAGAERAAATPHALVQAAWGLTLSAYTGETDHVFGSVRACRRLPVDGIERMVGMLINTVPFRVQLRHDESVGDLIARLREAQLAHRPHETTSASDVARFVGRPADEPLFPTLVMFTDRRPESMWHVDGQPHPTRSVQLLECSEFPLALCVSVDEQTTIRLEYDAGRYDAGTAAGIVDYFTLMLTTLAADVDRIVGDLPSVTPADRSRLLAWSRGPEPAASPATTIAESIERHSHQRPADVAILAAERTITYSELRNSALNCASRLQRLGIERGDFVGVFCDRSPEAAMLVLALWRLGAVYVPLDPKYPSARLGAIVADAAPKLVVHDRAPVEQLQTGGARRTVALAALYADDKPCDAPCPAHERTSGLEQVAAIVARPSDRAVVLYTSGSTGTPKGVVLTHANLANQQAYVVRTLSLTAGDRLTPVSSINFDASLEEHFAPLAAGATLVFAEPDTLDSCARFVEFIERRRLTILDLPTSLWRELTNYLHGERREYPDCVRLIFMGGEAATLTVYERFLRVGGRRIRWINAYGPTETTICSTCYEHRPERDSVSGAAPPIGRPIDHTTAFVVDRRGKLAPPGVSGELYLGGAGVGEGYLNRDDLTRERFVARPSADLPEGRYYRTGDEVRFRADGELEYLGRLDGQVKLRGFRIEPGEIEAALLQHPTVRDVAVDVRTSPSGAQYLAAYLVLHDGAYWDELALKCYATERLPQYMVPGAFVQLESLPLSPNGKIERSALPEPCLAESAAEGRAADAGRAPTPFEERLLEVWRQVLQIDDLGLDDDFFRLGGDSLRAMTLAAKLEKAVGRTVSAAMLLAAPTAALLAARLEAETADLGTEASASVVLLREGDSSRPLFLVHSLAGDVWIYRELVSSLRTDAAVYGLQMPGLDGQPAPDDDGVETWAARYLQHVRLLQPCGPYRFAGYSSGGLLALEMARQAIAAGEQVEFVGLIDSGVPAGLERRLAPSTSRRALQFFRKLPGALHELQRRTFAEQQRCLARQFKRLFQYFRESRKSAPDDELNDREVLECFAEDISFFPEERLNQIRRHYRALDRYDTPPLNLSVHLFRSARQPMFALPSPAMGWEHLIRGALEVHHVGGAHATLMQAPHVERLAAAIDEALSAATLSDKALAATSFSAPSFSPLS